MTRNISLDFFRGIMALFVCAGHYFYWNKITNAMPLSFILAVDFFLVLSGFVLSASVLEKKEFDSYVFFKNRYLRLFPVYIFCVLVTVVPYTIYWGYSLPNGVDLLKILFIGEILPLRHLSFTYLEPLGISYTISAELWVGIFLFPFIRYLYEYKKILLYPILILIVLITFIKIVNDSNDYMGIHFHEAWAYIPFGLVRCLMDYSIGILAYLLYSNTRNSRYWESTMIQVIVLFVCIFTYAKLDYSRVNEFVAPFIFGILIMSLATRQGVVFKLTNNKLGEFLGDISYPLYLIHPLFINLYIHTFKLNMTTSTFLFYILSCISLSYLINVKIEKPFMKLLKK